MNKTLAILLAAGLLLGMGTAADAYSILGTGDGALLGGDITDPDNNINDNVPGNPPYYGTGYDFITAAAVSQGTFSPGSGHQAALDVFDNNISGQASGREKWCCNGATQWVAVEFADPYALSHFTLSSGGDAPGRRPDVWAIQGSNDSTNGLDGTWSNIYSYSNDNGSATGGHNHADTSSPFTAHRQVVLFESPAGPNAPSPGSADFPYKDGTGYTWLRYQVTSTAGWAGGGGQHQLGEIELFGAVVPEPTTLLVWSLLAGLGVGLGWRRRK